MLNVPFLVYLIIYIICANIFYFYIENKKLKKYLFVFGSILIVYSFVLYDKANYKRYNILSDQKVRYVKVVMPDAFKIDKDELMIVNRKMQKMYCNYKINDESSVTIYNCYKKESE